MITNTCKISIDREIRTSVENNEINLLKISRARGDKEKGNRRRDDKGTRRIVV